MAAAWMRDRPENGPSAEAGASNRPRLRAVFHARRAPTPPGINAGNRPRTRPRTRPGAGARSSRRKGHRRRQRTVPAPGAAQNGAGPRMGTGRPVVTSTAVQRLRRRRGGSLAETTT
ncbi:hypothetical protein GCM10010324_57200 [Streptomyces hiroshimensis]|uniref:Uncharacterized protein n=1 Tax=Streptomyces hiroshimensis TaxID=66424 RepID=A0ABQ2Z2D3_9ACTN|nr:hypothetical protein GCM10010324_57200 [Streptomyces hiroshimensis]